MGKILGGESDPYDRRSHRSTQGNVNASGSELKDDMKVLVDDALVAGWVREGLPSDPTSVQNGTILTNSERWPLMLDPQLQGANITDYFYE